MINLLYALVALITIVAWYFKLPTAVIRSLLVLLVIYYPLVFMLKKDQLNQEE